MQKNRDVCIQECLKWEGGYTNNAADPGGPTNWGITIADAKRYWKKDATAADVKAMPKEVAINIYASKYWKTPYYDCDKLAPGVDLAVFDFGVNSGPARAKKYLDLSVGGDASDTVTKICDKRLSFLRSLKTWSTFGRGWESRVKGIKAKALQMAKDPVPAGTGAAGAIVVGAGGAAATAPETWFTWAHIAELGLAIVVVGVLAEVIIHSFKKNTKVVN